MAQQQALIGLDAAEIGQILGPDQPGFRKKQVYQALYRQKVSRLGEVSNIPRDLRTRLEEQYALGLPEVAGYYDSTDGTRRYLLRLQDDRTVETVLMPEEG